MEPKNAPQLTGISAVALSTQDMKASVAFYRTLGFVLVFGGDEAPFSTLKCGISFLNLVSRPNQTAQEWWGRVIFHVSDVDAIYEIAANNGFAVEAPPRDAEWGERYFHVTDPAGHELSFAKPLG